MNVLVFDIWGQFAHFKKIYATTSAVSYPIPFKTAIYGLIGAIIGLEKTENAYLKDFEEGKCNIALQLLNRVQMQRININLQPHYERLKEGGNRKPTAMEFVREPRYRIYFYHQDKDIYNQLHKHLIAHTAVYTPTLGLASLLANFNFVGEYPIQAQPEGTTIIHSVISRKHLVRFDAVFENGNEIVEISQYALEMDTDRNVTQRDDIFIDRTTKAIPAVVKQYWQVPIANNLQNIVFL